VFESLITLGLVLFFCIIAWALSGSADSLIWGGIALATLGFAYGIPAAIVYHWRLHRSLVRCGRLPARWWLHPTTLHDLIPRGEQTGVLFWGALGGSGFVVIVIGILLTSIGLWRTLAP